jgi:hypothetical protein
MTALAPVNRIRHKNSESQFHCAVRFGIHILESRFSAQYAVNFGSAGPNFNASISISRIFQGFALGSFKVTPMIPGSFLRGFGE